MRTLFVFVVLTGLLAGVTSVINLWLWTYLFLREIDAPFPVWSAMYVALMVWQVELLRKGGKP